jgi:hypothetical protein
VSLQPGRHVARRADGRIEHDRLQVKLLGGDAPQVLAFGEEGLKLFGQGPFTFEIYP